MWLPVYTYPGMHNERGPVKRFIRHSMLVVAGDRYSASKVDELVNGSQR